MTDAAFITRGLPHHCQMCGRYDKRLIKRWNRYQRIYQWVCPDGCAPQQVVTRREPIRLGMTLKEIFEDMS